MNPDMSVNTHGLIKKAVATTAPQIDPLMTYSRYKIVDEYPAKKRFVIQYRDHGEKVKMTFNYAKRSKEEALAEAEAARAELVRKNFI
jgi:hypothetical protein